MVMTPRNLNILKSVSAEHTGCPPELNEISNVTIDIAGDGTWTARCADKVFVCTAYSGQVVYSCVPAAHADGTAPELHR